MEHEAGLAQAVALDDMASAIAHTDRDVPRAKPRPLAVPDKDRIGVFTSLVREDGDIPGLVAYSLYKQNKLDWLQAFETLTHRAPDDAEISAYIIGESTPRRLATYRHLAEATLAGNGPGLDGLPSPRASFPRDQSAQSKGGIQSSGLIAVYAVGALFAMAALWLATHYTLSAR